MQTSRVDVDHFKAFDAMMQGIYTYFGHTYKGDRVSIVYQHISDCRIPSDAFQQIGSLLKDTLDSTSGNIGKRIKEAWAEVSKTRRMTSTSLQEAQPCDQCGGAGAFSAIKDGYSYAFRCAGCSNWAGKLGIGVPAAYPLELQTHQWYEIKLYPSPFETGSTYDAAMARQLISSAGKSVGPAPSSDKERARARNIKTEQMREYEEAPF